MELHMFYRTPILPNRLWSVPYLWVHVRTYFLVYRMHQAFQTKIQTYLLSPVARLSRLLEPAHSFHIVINMRHSFCTPSGLLLCSSVSVEYQTTEQYSSRLRMYIDISKVFLIDPHILKLGQHCHSCVSFLADFSGVIIQV